VITAVIGSGVLSLAWSVAQMGWVVGPTVLLLFALVTYYTALLLTDCYRYPDPVLGKRNYTYMDAVQANLGKFAPSNSYKQLRYVFVYMYVKSDVSQIGLE
jgi:amino acid permease